MAKGLNDLPNDLPMIELKIERPHRSLGYRTANEFAES